MVSAGTPVMGSAHSGVLRTPSARPKRYERYDEPGGALGRQVLLVQAEHEAVAERLVVEPLAHDDVGHGDEHGRVRGRAG